MNGLKSDKYNQKIKIKTSSIHGRGVFSVTTFNKGDKIGYFEGYPVQSNTRHSLTFNGVKIEPTGLLKCLNHSCSPNSYFRDRVLVANRNIKPKEEITVDYLATEADITNHFECNCKSYNCRKLI